MLRSMYFARQSVWTCYGYMNLKVLRDQALRRWCGASEGKPAYPGWGFSTLIIQHLCVMLLSLWVLFLWSAPHNYPALDFSRCQTTQTHLLKIRKRALNLISFPQPARNQRARRNQNTRRYRDWVLEMIELTRIFFLKAFSVCWLVCFHSATFEHSLENKLFAAAMYFYIT